MLTINDVQVDFRTEQQASGRVKITMLVDDTKVVSKACVLVQSDAEVAEHIERMRAEYDRRLRSKLFNSSRGQIIGSSYHAIPKKMSLWWDDDEFYLVTENTVAVTYCERMSEAQALAWARAYLNLEALGQPGQLAIKPVEDIQH